VFTQIFFFFFFFFGRQLRELASCRQLDRIRLGPRPGGRVRSVVSAPKEAKEKSKVLFSERGGHGGGMVDLDESSNDEEHNSREPLHSQVLD
jgi:hypothetical protein